MTCIEDDLIQVIERLSREGPALPVERVEDGDFGELLLWHEGGGLSIVNKAQFLDLARVRPAQIVMPRRLIWHNAALGPLRRILA